jgi:hypothetical protein
MTSTWTSDERSKFLRLCGLDGFRRGLPKVTPPRPVIKLMRGASAQSADSNFESGAPIEPPRQIKRVAKQMRLSLSRANIDEDDRAICEIIRKHQFLRTEERREVERIWAYVCERDRADATAR